MGRGQCNGQVHKVDYRFHRGLLMFQEIQTEMGRDEKAKTAEGRLHITW